MTQKQRIIFLLVTAVTTVGLVYSSQAKREKEGSKEPKGGSSSSSVQVEQVWKLPTELNEISANVLIDADRMACVQDNDGIIFVYNLKTKSIEQRITFAGKGDYEGLALVGDTYYVSRGDGFLYEIKTSKDKPVVTTYDLAFGIENDTEPLFYDKKGDRLLIGTKEKDLSGGDGKGVYSFDLGSKKLSPERVMTIPSSYDDNKESASGHNDENVKNSEHQEDGDKNGGKNNKYEVKPSEIAIHPTNGDVYVLDGPRSELFIADATGNIKSSYQLDKKVFPQPEGMCFSPSGDLYISSEGGKAGKGVIARVDLNRTAAN